MKRLFSFLRTLSYVILVSLIFLGLGRVKVIAKAAGWDHDFVLSSLRANTDGFEDEKAKVIDEYLREKDSVMVGMGKYFVVSARDYDLPVYLLVAMAGAESNFGCKGYAVDTYNAFGLGVHEGRRYNSWEEGISDLAFVLRNYYFDEGLDQTVEIQNKWAPRGLDGNGWQNTWADNVDYFMAELEKKEKEISL
ncbi:MAG: glucosaminidase domain-containing protein [Patescibacteria group bacterium]